MRAERPARKTIRAIHPTRGEVVVTGVVDKLDAAIAAARTWGLQWSQVLREADFREEEEQR